MAINFPLSLPASPGFSRLELIHHAKTGLTESSFNFYEQAQEWAERWEASCTLPPISDRATLGQWEAFLLALRGGVGTFLMGDPKKPNLLGVGPGSGMVPWSEAQAAGTKLITTGGWGASISGPVKKGDVFQLTENRITKPMALNEAPWVAAGTNPPTVTANDANDPEGNLTAEKLAFPATAIGEEGYLEFNTGVVPLSGEPWSLAAWLRGSGAGQNIWLRTVDGTGHDASTEFTPPNGAWSSTPQVHTATVASAGGNTLLARIQQNASQGAKTIHAWGLMCWSHWRPARLHMFLAGAPQGPFTSEMTTDANGVGIFEIWPRLRAAAPDFSPLILTNAVGTWRLRPGAWQRSLTAALIAGLGFEAFEAINLA